MFPLLSMESLSPSIDPGTVGPYVFLEVGEGGREGPWGEGKKGRGEEEGTNE